MIRLEKAGRTFRLRGAPPVEALRDVSLETVPGSVTAVVGPNGAGKTTLFALVLGFLRPTSGRVLVGGTDPRRAARSHGAAWLPERFALPAGWRVAETLRAFARLEGLDPAAAARATDDLLARFNLGPHASKPAEALSRGTLQRVGLAQALLARRELVVLDEPTQGLDPLWRVRLREVIAELREDGRTILLASHELDEVERLADRAVVLRGGTIEDVVELRGASATDATATYLVELERDVAVATSAAFPDAERAPGSGERVVLRVRVSDTADLSVRLGVLIDAGARIVSVRPADAGLEQRVRGDDA